MSYEDDDDDDSASIHGAGSLASGFSHWPSLRQPAEHWSETLKRDQSKPKRPESPANVEGQDEIRWGDIRAKQILVPAGVSGLVGLTPFSQLVQLRRPARTWSLMYSVEFTNPASVQLLADESLIGFFSIYLGVGSSRIRIARDIPIDGPTGAPTFAEFGIESSFVDQNMPAAELVLSVTAGVQASGLAVANRLFTINLRCHAAPTTR